MARLGHTAVTPNRTSTPLEDTTTERGKRKSKRSRDFEAEGREISRIVGHFAVKSTAVMYVEVHIYAACVRGYALCFLLI
jgi:hypothetical protein